MADVRDIITDALNELGVISAGETVVEGDASYGLDTLNRLIDQWAAERLMIYTVTRTTFTISSTQNYSIGDGSTIDVARPVRIDLVTYYDSSISPPQEIRLTGPLSEQAWQGLPIKSQTSTVPSHCYYNPTFPTGTLSIWPIPSDSNLVGVVYAPEQVSEFSSLSTAISLPPGYRRMLVKNLALEMAPAYERTPNAALVQQAQESKMVVKRANYRIVDLGFDPAVLGSGGIGYDINTDQ